MFVTGKFLSSKTLTQKLTDDDNLHRVRNLDRVLKYLTNLPLTLSWYLMAVFCVFVVKIKFTNDTQPDHQICVIPHFFLLNFIEMR